MPATAVRASDPSGNRADGADVGTEHAAPAATRSATSGNTAAHWTIPCVSPGVLHSRSGRLSQFRHPDMNDRQRIANIRKGVRVGSGRLVYWRDSDERIPGVPLTILAGLPSPRSGIVQHPVLNSVAPRGFVSGRLLHHFPHTHRQQWVE